MRADCVFMRTYLQSRALTLTTEIVFQYSTNILIIIDLTLDN